MATKIRLQRRGRKSYAFYAIVIADSKAPRDGRFIEKIGTYNPNTNPATVDLNFERALHWVMTGAQPTDTTRNILSHEGVLLKKHLLEGVKKGAFDAAEAEKRLVAMDKKFVPVAILPENDERYQKYDAYAAPVEEKKILTHPSDSDNRFLLNVYDINHRSAQQQKVNK